MDEKKKNILKSGGMEVGSDFTSKIMGQINAEETALSNVLSRHGDMETSADFTAQFMTQLEGKSPKALYKPVISKNTWIGLAAAFIGVIVMVIFSGGEGSGRLNMESVESVKNGIGEFFSGGALTPYLILGALLLSLALLFEQKVRVKAEQ